MHLGNDLNDHPQPDGFGRRSQSVDEDLARLIEHYRAIPPPAGKWRIVFAGDFVDFIGITILPRGEPLATEPSDEEREHGLGNAADHAREKLRRVAERHRDVFAALAAFVADGHALTIVHGNHDVEFHWEIVRTEFRAILSSHASIDEASLAARVEFNPWFFYADGVAYIEHGHQYDALCSTEHLMVPVSPLDPRRLARGFCDVLLRFVVRPTRGMREHGHEHLGVFDYLAFGGRLGVTGLVRLAVSFARAIVEMFRLRREWISEAAKALRDENDRRIAAFAQNLSLDLGRIRALLALQQRPITRSMYGILATVLLDRVALALFASGALGIVFVIGRKCAVPWGYSWGLPLAIVAAWVISHRRLTQMRNVDPDEALRERAGRLAKLFPAAFVVMGHTHVPVKMPVAEGAATYINVGSWAEEEDQADLVGGHRAARTHLVIHPGERGPVAEFLAWDSGAGPKVFNG